MTPDLATDLTALLAGLSDGDIEALIADLGKLVADMPVYQQDEQAP